MNEKWTFLFFSLQFSVAILNVCVLDALFLFGNVEWIQIVVAHIVIGVFTYCKFCVSRIKFYLP